MMTEEELRERLVDISNKFFELLEVADLDFAVPGTDNSLKTWVESAINVYKVKINPDALLFAVDELQYAIEEIEHYL